MMIQFSVLIGFTHHGSFAAILSLSCLFLAYSAYAVPMQLSFWNSQDPCDEFPTLFIDVVVDTYFMVSPISS